MCGVYPPHLSRVPQDTHQCNLPGTLAIRIQDDHRTIKQVIRCCHLRQYILISQINPGSASGLVLHDPDQIHEEPILLGVSCESGVKGQVNDISQLGIKRW